jgi:Ribonuclease G/E
MAQQNAHRCDPSGGDPGVVLRGNRVEEFDFESANRKQLRGNIYLAKVTRVEPRCRPPSSTTAATATASSAFSEIHPDYYQIPVADRQALIAEDERAQARRRARGRPSCRPPQRTLASAPAGAGARGQERAVEVESAMAAAPSRWRHQHETTDDGPTGPAMRAGAPLPELRREAHQRRPPRRIATDTPMRRRAGAQRPPSELRP